MDMDHIWYPGHRSLKGVIHRELGDHHTGLSKKEHKFFKHFRNSILSQKYVFLILKKGGKHSY